MTMIRTVGLLAGAATLSASGFAGATDIESASVDALRAELSELRTQNENLASRLDAQDNAWLNETRATEIRGIVQDVLADSQSRTSLQDSGAMAGYKAGRGFFLSSQNGSFTMNITGQLQTRFVMSKVGDEFAAPGTPIPGTNNVVQNNTNATDWGFQVRRAKVRFQGNVIDKTWHYEINGSFVGNDGQAGAFFFQEALIGHDVNDNMTLSFGQFKAPFTREELVSSETQLAVERSLVNEYFNADRMVGVNMMYATDAWRLEAAFGNGFRTAYGQDYTNTNSSNNPTKWSALARFDYKISGDWSDFDSFTSSPDAEEAMMFGVAVQGQSWNGELAQDASDTTSVMGVTADFSMKMAGMSIFGAVVYQNYANSNEGVDSINPWGFVGQVGYSLTDQWEVFGDRKSTRLNSSH